MPRQTEEQRVRLSRLTAAERERAIRSTTHRSDWRVFRDRMRSIAQDGVIPWHRDGLCYEAPGTIYDAVVNLQQCWPDHSGRRVFPVPAPLDFQVLVSRHYFRGNGMRGAEMEAAGRAYCKASGDARYEGAYGMYRRRLASFLWAAAEEVLDGTGESA